MKPEFAVSSMAALYLLSDLSKDEGDAVIQLGKNRGEEYEDIVPILDTDVTDDQTKGLW